MVSFPNESKFDKRQSYEFSLEVCTIERRKQNFFYNFVNYYAFQVFAYMNREPKNDVISNTTLRVEQKQNGFHKKDYQ